MDGTCSVCNEELKLVPSLRDIGFDRRRCVEAKMDVVAGDRRAGRDAQRHPARSVEETQMKLIKDMTEPELRDHFNRLAKLIEDWLPPGPSAKGKCLFFLVVNDQIEPGIAQYVSNVQRADAIKMLRETADRLEKREDVTR